LALLFSFFPGLLHFCFPRSCPSAKAALPWHRAFATLLSMLFSVCIWAEYKLYLLKKQFVFAEKTNCIRPKYNQKTKQSVAQIEL